MPDFQKKYIITGAPGTGKTTLVNLLKESVPCMDEVSRKVIIDEQKNRRNGMPWGDINRFAALVYKKTNEELSNSKALVCDRSLLDLEAYLTEAKKKIPDFLKMFPYHEIYRKKVFFAPTWFEIYCKDGQRLQEFDFCIKLEKVLIQEYRSKGFDLIKLPLTSPSARAKYVLDFVLKSTN